MRKEAEEGQKENGLILVGAEKQMGTLRMSMAGQDKKSRRRFG